MSALYRPCVKSEDSQESTPQHELHQPHRFAFAIVSLLLGGGLQRDCLGIARLVRSRGHHVKVFTTRFAGAEVATIGDVAVISMSKSLNAIRGPIMAAICNLPPPWQSWHGPVRQAHRIRQAQVS